MKILHVTQNYEPSIGGTQHTIKKISEYFAHCYNDDVTVYTTNSYFGPNRTAFKKIEPAREVINEVKVERFPFYQFHKPVIKLSHKILHRTLRKKLPAFFYHLNTGPISSKMVKAIKATDADVICASSLPYLFADYPAWKNKNKKPFVLYGALHVNDDRLDKRYFHRIQQCDYYIANTEFEKKYLVNCSIDEEKIKVIGAATNVFECADQLTNAESIKRKYGLPQNNFILLFLGRQDGSKGIGCLLSALKILKQQQKAISLIVAGAKGAFTEILDKEVANDRSIVSVVNISDVEKCELLSIADVLVLPSTEESFGVVFLEGWSYKKPVIGADIGAVASVITNRKDGLLFAPGNASNLASKIQLLIENEQMKISMGIEGYNKVMQKYTWPVVARKFHKVYELAIQKHRKII